MQKDPRFTDYFLQKRDSTRTTWHVTLVILLFLLSFLQWLSIVIFHLVCSGDENDSHSAVPLGVDTEKVEQA